MDKEKMKAYTVVVKLIVMAKDWKEAGEIVVDTLTKIPNTLNYYEVNVSEASQEDLMKTHVEL